jgi:tRNA-specific 2-thiouridylase
VAKKLQISEIIGNSESQDLCFLNSSSLINFLHERLPELFKRGEIIDLKTKKKLGNHQGILNFTIGQRARIGGLRKPLYVSKINTKTNTVYVSEKTDLKQKQLLICNPSWLSGTMPNLTNKKFQVQIRHQGKEADCQIYQTKTNTLLITVNQELKAVTPGQHAALYQESQLLGGGIINN